MMMTSRRLVVSAMLVLPIMAKFGLRPAFADDAADAQAFIDKQAQSTLSIASDKSQSGPAKADRYKQVLESAFDLPAIGQFVLARYWRSATPDQQQKFLATFADYNTLTWAHRFDAYSGQTVKTTGATKIEDGYQVESQVSDGGSSQPVELQWKVHKTDKGWGITDVIIAGASLALATRQDFSSVMQQNGGKIDALITTLQQKTQQLRA